MGYKVDWLGTAELGIITDGGRPITVSLEEDQAVPGEFHPGDELHIGVHPDHPSSAAMGMRNSGYYEITHVPSGKTLRIWFRANEHKIGTDL